MAGSRLHIGVLALQGAFREHRAAVEQLGGTSSEVRRVRELDGLDGLIVPGGESTTMRLLLGEFGLVEPLRARIGAGFPVLGTCAGMILLAHQVDGDTLPGLDGLNVNVQRNAFGRQVDSFETELTMPALGSEPFHAVFIRAPLVQSVGAGVDVLGRLDDGRVVAVRQGNVVGLAFHPELTPDLRIHQYFLDVVTADSCRPRDPAPAA